MKRGGVLSFRAKLWQHTFPSGVFPPVRRRLAVGVCRRRREGSNHPFWRENHKRVHQYSGALHKHTQRKQESQSSNPGQQPSTLGPSHESANTPRLARSGSTDQREFNRALTSAALAAPPPPLVLIVWSPLVPSIAWSPLTGCVVRVVVCSDPDVLFVARVSANLLCCS